MITFKHKGNFKRTEKFLDELKRFNISNILNKYGRIGVAALSSNTPMDSGLTAMSWDYFIEMDSRGAKITWVNNNVSDGTNVAILIQYGHGTGTGGYVSPRDFVNPTMKPIFDALTDEIWKEVAR